MSHGQLKPPKHETVVRAMNIVESFGLQVDYNTVALVIAAHESYLFGTSEGRLNITEECKMDVTLGESDMEYEVVDARPRVVAKGDQVYFFNAVVINGEFHRPSHVDGYHLEKETCDSCNVEFHCLTKTKDEFGKDLKLCNHCMYNSQLQRQRDESNGYDGCLNCSVLKCQHHPQKIFSGDWIKKG